MSRPTIATLIFATVLPVLFFGLALPVYHAIHLTGNPIPMTETQGLIALYSLAYANVVTLGLIATARWWRG